MLKISHKGLEIYPSTQIVHRLDEAFNAFSFFHISYDTYEGDFQLVHNRFEVTIWYQTF